MADESLTIYLVRHGESEWNREGRIQGTVDSPLTPLGFRQSGRIKAYFDDIPLTAVYASSLQRCRTLAEMLVKGRDIPLVYMHGLMERSQGDWEPLLIQEANRLFGEERRRVREDASARPPGGESAIDVWDRMDISWRRLIGRSRGSIAVVSHSGILSMILGNTLGLSRGTPFGKYPFYLSSGGISVIEMPGRGAGVVHQINDVCHLEGLADV